MACGATVTRFWDERFQLWVWMCQVVFSSSDEHKYIEQPAVWIVCNCLCMHSCFYFCAGSQVKCFCFSSGGERQWTGVIGSSLSPQTSEILHHRGISFQFSKSCHTSDTINKVFFFPPQTQGGKMQVSSYLIIPLIALQRENKLPWAVREKKTRLECMRRGKQAQLSSATLTLCGQCHEGKRATAQYYQRD